jgi:hypothetical protein
MIAGEIEADFAVKDKPLTEDSKNKKLEYSALLKTEASGAGKDSAPQAAYVVLLALCVMDC